MMWVDIIRSWLEVFKELYEIVTVAFECFYRRWCELCDIAY